MSERICWGCKQCNMDPGDPGYSEVTPGWNARIECLKGHWDWMNTGGNLRDCLMLAETCKDWEPL